MNTSKRFACIIVPIVLSAVVFLLQQRHELPRFDFPGLGPSSVTRVVAQGVETSNDDSHTTPRLVGREVCRECHAENYDWHSHSGHASTFFAATAPQVIGKYSGKTIATGDEFGTFTYETGKDGLLYVRHPKHPEPFELSYALGSGHHGITLLSLVPDPSSDQTMGIEHRVSWFASDNSFGVTPSQEDAVPSSSLEWLGLPVHGQGLELCVSCHTTSAEIVDQTIVNLVANVNCEKCHGPGSVHVAQARGSKSPPAFSVGKSQWNTESELRLCGSCHRLPKDIPRKLLRDYNEELTRFQPVGLLRSKCYLESEGSFKCSTCHNPHMTVKAKTDAQYVQDCIACHQTDQPSQTHCPVSPTSGCIQCHMPTVQLEHFAFHDHWIRVHDEK